MKVLVCGSRSYEDRTTVHSVLDLLTLALNADEKLIVVNGFAYGADRLADEWASERESGRPWRFGANWDVCDHTHPAVPCPQKTHRKTKPGSGDTQVRTYCPLAGVRRNADMLTEADPHLVLAFLDKSLTESKGTADMVRRARKAGAQVLLFGPDAVERGDR